MQARGSCPNRRCRLSRPPLPYGCAALFHFLSFHCCCCYWPSGGCWTCCVEEAAGDCRHPPRAAKRGGIVVAETGARAALGRGWHAGCCWTGGIGPATTPCLAVRRWRVVRCRGAVFRWGGWKRGGQCRTWNAIQQHKQQSKSKKQLNGTNFSRARQGSIATCITRRKRESTFLSSVNRLLLFEASLGDRCRTRARRVSLTHTAQHASHAIPTRLSVTPTTGIRRSDG